MEYLIEKITHAPINIVLLFCDAPSSSFRLYWPSSGRSFTKEYNYKKKILSNM
jgi:hypothetical protein